MDFRFATEHLGKEALGLSPRVAHATDHAVEAGVAARAREGRFEGPRETVARDPLEHVAGAFSGTLGGAGVPVGGDFGDWAGRRGEALEQRRERLDALAGGRHRSQDGDVRAVALGEPLHRLELALGAVGALAVALIDDEDVGDLEEPGLDGLDLVAEPRHEHDDGRVRHVDDLDLVLPDADRLDEDRVVAHRVEDGHEVDGRAREAAQVPAGGDRADEDRGIERMLLHANAVAEDGPARERARGVDRDDAHLLPGRSVGGDEGRGQRRLARARVAGDADDVRAPGGGVQRAQEIRGARMAVVHQAHEACSGPDFTGQDPRDELALGVGQGHAGRLPCLRD